MSKEDSAYFAGLFDGEGCVTTRNSHRTLILSVSQKDPAVLSELQEKLGSGRLGCWGGVWRLRISKREDVQRLIIMILPYSRVKRPQLEVALQLLEMRGYRKSPQADELHEQLAALKSSTGRKMGERIEHVAA